MIFIETLKNKFKLNEPIFSNEIIKLFPNYSRAYIFKLIKKALERKELIKFCDGVYYMPILTELGYSTISANDVIIKKYIFSNGNFYGFFSGLSLLNSINLTTQVPNKIEVVTNKETNISRRINVNGQIYILKKSRTKINKNNINEYMFLETLSYLKKIDSESKKQIMDYYFNKNKISQKNISKLTLNFPSNVSKKYIELGF